MYACKDIVDHMMPEKPQRAISPEKYGRGRPPKLLL